MRAPAILFLSIVCVLSLAQTAQSATVPVRSPQVTHTKKGPTGYTVTFRYANPAAKSVRIRGEWYFTRLQDLPQLIGTPDHPFVQSEGLLPKDWKPGDFPQHKFFVENAREMGNWPFAELTKGKDGVWTYTTPLPSGVFTYSFAVDCTDPDPLKCKWMSDPSNRPWNETKDGVVTGSTNYNSQVYVPSDPAFHTVDYSWQAPSKHPGKLTEVTYPSPGHLDPKDENYLVVYTPPDYDPNRAKPYPTLYLAPGLGNGNEMNWSTQAVLGNIMDNLINDGEIQPAIVVMGPREAGFVDGVFFEVRHKDLIDNAIPYIEKHYHVSTSPMDRAFSGGGGATVDIALNHAALFEYFGITAAGLPVGQDALTPAQIAGLKGKGIQLGGGRQDITFLGGILPNYTGVSKEVTAFAKAGIPVTTDFINSGHEYYMYRILLRDFLIHVAFQPLPYAN